MTAEKEPRGVAGPLDQRRRAPAPDLARGVMLLLISLANTPFYLYGRATSQGSSHPVDGTLSERIVQFVMITGVDLRVYPMFAFLFGYGLMMVYRRQTERGLPERDAWRLLQRRNLWLLVFGAVHALLLWGGDILGAYGLCGLLLVAVFIRRANKTLLWWAAGGAVALAILAALTTLGALEALAEGESSPAGVSPPDFIYRTASEESTLTAAGLRMMMWPLQTILVQGPASIVVPVAILLGFWGARRRLLERPGEHLRLLRATAALGICIGWAGGLPHALAHVGVIDGLADVMWLFGATQMVTGLAGGIGYVALFGLIGHRLASRQPGPVQRSISAVGKRSLTCYLAQSVLCAPVLAAWGSGLGAQLNSTTMALYAIGVWLATVVFATVLERHHRPGPADALLRRLTYRSAVRSSS